MANPPFNVDKVKSEPAASAGRLPFGLPSVNKEKEFGNANYLWIGYFATALNENGKAALVMANSASDAGKSDEGPGAYGRFGRITAAIRAVRF
jgi:type I restriction enzyme M protein